MKAINVIKKEFDLKFKTTWNVNTRKDALLWAPSGTYHSQLIYLIPENEFRKVIRGVIQKETLSEKQVKNFFKTQTLLNNFK